ncbi:conserved protein of unknown function [Legionella fallonii LLAP-10]|uniref:Uncharacterized protein n=2 Tax=Legionella fallonii TaxID=96230 RepID=A0A098FZ43_9GAMM|nr:conserved protein of unknown function [Legionella fallonii LLAP-10]
MPHFFTKPSNILIEHELTLAEYLARKVKFNPNDPLHTQLITSCAQSVKERLANLQSIDIKMTAGFAIGIAALLLSYFLPFTLVAIAGFAYGSYQLAQRQYAYAEHSSALENLSKSCLWVLGDVNVEQQRNHALNNVPAVQEMITTLAPLTSTEQLRELIDTSIGEVLLQEIEKIKENITLFDEHLDKEKMDLYFKIYGYKQGGFWAISSGIGYAIKNGFSALASTISSCFSSASSSTAPSDSSNTNDLVQSTSRM